MKILKELESEIAKARANFPGPEKRYAALVEEFSEVAHAVCEDLPFDRVRSECIQLACTAIRFAEEGDPAFGYFGERDECEKCGSGLGKPHLKDCPLEGEGIPLPGPAAAAHLIPGTAASALGDHLGLVAHWPAILRAKGTGQYRLSDELFQNAPLAEKFCRTLASSNFVCLAPNSYAVFLPRPE